MRADIKSTIRLNNGVEMPRLGLGVYLADRGAGTQRAVEWALEAGYRLIDTASMYGNERDVGDAVRNSGIPREEIFITTKLWNSDHGYQRTLDACNKSLDRLGMEYVDLYLIHWPVENMRRETWKAMVKLYEDGKCLSIGVSNYLIRHLEELAAYSDFVPDVNQVEFSPFLYQKSLLEYCEANRIRLEAYAPLTRGKELKNRLIVSLAEKYEKTAAQIMIRWALQHDMVVIPKSVHRERILENADVFDFDISEEDMSRLDSLNENLHVSWDPSGVR